MVRVVWFEQNARRVSDPSRGLELIKRKEKMFVYRFAEKFPTPLGD